MPVILSLSPWASFWTMGKGGGTPSDFVAVQALQQLGLPVLHFVEDGQPCDPDNIPIPVHMQPIYRPFTQLRRLGYPGQRLLFALQARAWRRYNEEFYRSVSDELRQRQIESLGLIYCHTAYLVDCGRKLAKHFKCPVVVHFYGTFLAQHIGKPKAYWKNPVEYLGWTTPVDMRICNDDGTRGNEVALDLNLPMKKFLFQPHGMDTEELDAVDDGDLLGLIEPERVYIMTASRLVGWKRIDRLLQVIPQLVERIPNTHFLIVGDGPALHDLQAYAKQIGVDPWVTFVGAMPRESVFRLMKQCSVFVSTNDVSNVSRGLKEAMYYGMCIVTVDTGNTSTLIQDGVTGRLVPPDDPADLSQALIEVLTDTEMQQRLGNQAAQFIRENEPTQKIVLAERVTRLMALMR